MLILQKLHLLTFLLIFGRSGGSQEPSLGNLCLQGLRLALEAMNWCHSAAKFVFFWFQVSRATFFSHVFRYASWIAFFGQSWLNWAQKCFYRIFVRFLVDFWRPGTTKTQILAESGIEIKKFTKLHPEPHPGAILGGILAPGSHFFVKKTIFDRKMF